ncbi:MAG TPA: hypothetical protein VN848_11190, partial [Gemmatimonadales bacterium]|nr:hypothetical protein [Gemmatimonadales bacterium]
MDDLGNHIPEDRMNAIATEFPATLEVDYPDRELNRLTTFFRALMVIPIAIVLAFVAGPTIHAGSRVAF